MRWDKPTRQAHRTSPPDKPPTPAHEHNVNSTFLILATDRRLPTHPHKKRVPTTSTPPSFQERGKADLWREAQDRSEPGPATRLLTMGAGL